MSVVTEQMVAPKYVQILMEYVYNYICIGYVRPRVLYQVYNH